MRTQQRLTSCARLRTILWAGLIALPAFLPSAVRAAEPGHEVLGNWKLTTVLDATRIASINEKQARKLLGHIFTIDKDGARFDRELCGRTDFDAERVEPNLYLERADPYVKASTLGLPNPVTVVDVSCTSVFVKNRNRLVIFWKGFYFDAVRQKS